MILPFVIRHSEFVIAPNLPFVIQISSFVLLPERLTPATLAKAFRGELVPQDAADEPAGVLLERLRIRNQASATKPKRGRRAAQA